jgi:hypothetical protein
MADPPKKLVTWKNWVLMLLVLAAWAGYRLYRDYQAAGQFETVNVVSVIVAVSMGLIITIAVFLYANRPEPGAKK